jgi:hypothetical protein
MRWGTSYSYSLAVSWALVASTVLSARPGDGRLFAIRRCAESIVALASEAQRLALSDDEHAFVAALLPEIGARAVVGPNPETPRWARAADGALETLDHRGVRVRIVFAKDASPEVSVDAGTQTTTLRLPEGFRLEQLADRGRSLVRRTFLGHTLYPFLVDRSPEAPERLERARLGEPALVHREIQDEVIGLGRELLRRFDREGRVEDQRFLAVSPTGTGKSEMVRSLLRERLETRGRGLYVVMSDYADIVAQLSREVEAIPQGGGGVEALPVRIVRWDGGRRQDSDASDLAALKALVDESPVPVVLVTTAASFRLQLKAKQVEETRGEEAEFVVERADLESLRAMLKYWVYDEAHHAGAMQIGRILEASLEGNREAAALFVTATPDRRVQELAGGQGYYTYLDEPATWLRERGSAGRTPGEAYLQLLEAYRRGDLVGFRHARPLVFARAPDEAVFERRGQTGPRELLDEHYGSLYAQIERDVLRKPTVLSASSQAEAVRVARFLAVKLGGQRKVALVTADNENEVLGTPDAIGMVFRPLRRGEAVRRFNVGELHVLVTVNRLNEGVDLPPAQVLVDLRESPNPLDFLQRLGRTTRTAPGKLYDQVEIYMVSKKTRSELEAELDALVRGANTQRNGSGSGGNGGAEPLRMPLLDVLPRVVEAGRLDFWEVSETEKPLIASESDLPRFEPLRRALMETFSGATGKFSLVTGAFREALPEAKHEEWDARLRALFDGKAPSEHLLAGAKTRPYNAEKALQTVLLYAELRGFPVPESHYLESKDFEAPLRRFRSLVSPEADLSRFEPLRRALMETFNASAKFSRVTSAFREALPEEKRLEWDAKLLELFDGKTPSETLLHSVRVQPGSAEKALRTVLLYAELQYLPIPESHYLDAKDFEALLERFRSQALIASESDVPRFEPLRRALMDTFSASTKFSRVTGAFREALPEAKHEEWDARLLALFDGKAPNEQLLAGARTKPFNAEKALQTVLLYAELRGLPVPESHYLDAKDFEALLERFRQR